MPPETPKNHRPGLRAAPGDRPVTSHRSSSSPSKREPIPDAPAEDAEEQPRARFGKRPIKRKGRTDGASKAARGKVSPRKWVRRGLEWSIAAAVWVFIAVAVVVVYYASDLPDLNSLTATLRKPSITVMSADGETIAAYGDVYGNALTLDQIPAYLPQAVMATEDRRFYSHFGIDVIGIGRAVFVDLRSHRMMQGGSTITQQLAKNLFLTPERSAKRKIQEWLLAFSLERKFSKNQILTLYLNRVYLGSGIWGVDAAARHYFNIPGTQLDLYQSALLAGLLKAPSHYNPQNDRALSAQRTSQVLANMVAAGYITPEQADAARKTGPSTIRPVFHTGRYFADWVREQAAEYAGTDRDIVVQTTLDMGLQRKAEAELEALLAGPGVKAGVTQGAIVILSPDGAIRAMVGGRDYATSQFNRASQGYRQPGSSFKAFLYLAAMEDGYKPDDMIEDSPITTGRYRPEDFGHKYEGTITLRHAFAESSNVAAVRLIEKIGPKRVVAVARRLGITSPLHADASLALGTSETTLLEMTGAYAAFANGGDDVFPYGFAGVTDGPGHAVYQRDGGGTGRVIDRDALAKMTDLLVAVVQGGTGKAAALDRPVGGKTGTTQDYRDAWFIGFTADYVAGVWLGNDDGTSLNKITGGSLPTKLWHNVMVAAHQGLPVRDLPGAVPEPSAESETPAADNKTPATTPEESSESVWDSLVHMLGGGSHP